MHAPFLAAVLSVACLLSACGFVPPAPPTPDNGPRIAINHGDPRKTEQPTATMAATPTTAQGTNADGAATGSAQHAHAVSVTAIPIPAAPPESPTSAITSPSATAAATTETTPPATKSTLITSATTTMTDAQPTLSAKADAVSPDEQPAAPSEAMEEEPAPAPIIPKTLWHIQPEDGTVRQALVRWASKAGWTFGPDQWELNFDLPIQAPAEFQAESFQEATQALSQAIAMTESPVRPCFYANRVLRMVPFARSCSSAALSTPSP